MTDERRRSPSSLSQRVREAENLTPHRAWAARSSANRPPRSVLYKRRVYDLEQYRQDQRSRKYEHLTREQKLDMFGSTVVPIPVPLAPGETGTQYEERFLAWLSSQNITLGELETSSDEHLERFYRIKFAKMNVSGTEAFEPHNESKIHRKRSRSWSSERSVDTPTRRSRRDDDASTQRDRDTKYSRQYDRNYSSGSSTNNKPRDRHDDVKFQRSDSDSVAATSTDRRSGCTLELPADGAAMTVVVEAYISCGCRRCLVTGMGGMVEKLASMESTPGVGATNQLKTTNGCVDLTEDCDAASPPRSREPSRKTADAITKLVLSKATMTELTEQVAHELGGDSNHIEVIEDVVENQLVREYDALNLRVEQAVLRASSSTTLETAIDDRIAALAMVIVYLWRHNAVDLDEMVSDQTTTTTSYADQEHTSHHICAQLSSAIASSKTRITKIKQELDVVIQATSFTRESDRLDMMASLGNELMAIESSIQTLRDQRLREFVVLVQASEHLRGLIRTLLSPD